MDYNIMMIMIFGVVLVSFGITYLISKSKAFKDTSKTKTKKSKGKDVVQQDGDEVVPYKKRTDGSVAKEDLFNFMEFDRIQDNMIIQQNGEKYTAVIKCKGINYNLMSEVEQLAVEEGFMNFLNTLKFPVQLYVQAQTVNLQSNIKDYKENMKAIHEEFDEVSSEYNSVLNSLESTDEQIEAVEDKRSSILNVLEYGNDIVRYVEKLAINKNMLQRRFYVLVSYYKSELSNSSSFNKDELLDICYSELFTRVQNVISGLSMCAVSATPLGSNDIAELLYSAYNRDDKNYMSVQQALESGFYRLYSTSEDAITRKNKKLVETLKQEAEYKALVALNKAIEEETLVTQLDAEEAFDQESSRQAIELIKGESLPEKVKQTAKKIVVEDYKKAKKQRIEKSEEKAKATQEKIRAIRNQQTGNRLDERDEFDGIVGAEDNADSASDDAIV